MVGEFKQGVLHSLQAASQEKMPDWEESHQHIGSGQTLMCLECLVLWSHLH
jgi:hypothetical protein